ncbi:hypothetical protein M446_1479 [Methylobacterium sp. 4-46]|nr:hypothetical protein M446_1479 [Methylobacterium sp. 4-46]
MATEGSEGLRKSFRVRSVAAQGHLWLVEQDAGRLSAGTLTQLGIAARKPSAKTLGATASFLPVRAAT